MGRGALAAAIALLSLAEAATAQTRQRRPVTEEDRAAAHAALERFTSPRLTRFGSEAEFQSYAAAVLQVHRTRGDYYYAGRGDRARFAQAAVPGGATVQSDELPPCYPDLEFCPEEGGQTIMVTGSAVRPRNPSITNNQFRSVEEGDIVKQIDRFLLVLQDGRIFVVDTRARGRRLALADRVNVYRDPRSDIWYDEMLVFGDRILITGYSYRQDATELSVFRLRPTGRLAREGVFYMSSDDYYSSTNYATRLIGDDLVIYTPFAVTRLHDPSFRWPVVRRWLAEEDRELAEELGRPLLDAANVYRPVRTEREPVVHTVSVCPLAPTGDDRELECRATAFVGPAYAQWIVTDRHAFVWTGSAPWEALAECSGNRDISPSEADPALLYRVPIFEGSLSVAAARGYPVDQFSLHPVGDRLFALLRLSDEQCDEPDDAPPRLRLLGMPLGWLGNAPAELPDSLYSRLPSTDSHWIANRFTDRYLVYGALSRFRRGLPDPADIKDYPAHYLASIRKEIAPSPAFAVPLDRPQDVAALDVGHTVIRAELVGDDIVVTGYRDRGGLVVTMLDLGRRPRIASSVRLEGRYESEGRSHAFNSVVERDGGGLMGVPTVPRVEDSDRAWWRSRASDVSFLEFDRRGDIAQLGELSRRFDYLGDVEDGVLDDDGVPGYSCEVSCVDWYGNSRPIFTDGRIFALAGAELIEGRIRGGRIEEVQRLNIALESVRR